jgi:ureidoacrylate peracid hydrolase
MPQESPRTLSARPAPIAIDPAHTAVIVVDMQNDFGATGGMFDREGIDIGLIRSTVAPTARVLASARSNGIPVIYLLMQHRADLSDAGVKGSPHRERLPAGDSATAPDGSPTRVLIEGEWGTRIVDDLAPEPMDILVPKHRFSGFFETPLHSILQGLGVRHLIFTGCTTSICVESTVRDAMFRDYSSVVLEDCTAEPLGHDNTRSNHEASLLTIEAVLGWVSNSDDFITALAN